MKERFKKLKGVIGAAMILSAPDIALSTKITRAETPSITEIEEMPSDERLARDRTSAAEDALLFAVRRNDSHDIIKLLSDEYFAAARAFGELVRKKESEGKTMTDQPDFKAFERKLRDPNTFLGTDQKTLSPEKALQKKQELLEEFLVNKWRDIFEDVPAKEVEVLKRGQRGLVCGLYPDLCQPGM